MIDLSFFILPLHLEIINYNEYANYIIFLWTYYQDVL